MPIYRDGQVDVGVVIGQLNADNLSISLEGVSVRSFLYGFDSGGGNWDRLASSAAGLVVDTELPAAGALGDTLANPTTPMIGANLLLYNGAEWDMGREGTVAGSLLTDVVDRAARDLGQVDIAVFNTAITPADTTATPTTSPPVASFNMVYNGAEWDMLREGTIAGSIIVDTELSAAAALTDNFANPTVPGVGAFLMGWDGGDWDRVTVGASGLAVDTELPAAAALTDDFVTPTAPAVGAFGMYYDGAAWDMARGTAVDGLLVDLGGNNDVDTELPAAAALGDGDGNPTTPTVGAALLGWNSASWDRLVSSIANGLEVDVTRVQGALDTELPAAAALSDALANPTAPGVGAHLMLYDETDWERAQVLQAPNNVTGRPIGHQAVGKTEGKATYRVAFKDLAALAGIGVRIAGNATTTTRVTRVQIAKPSVAQAPLRIVKTSTAAHGGTATTPTPIPLDSADGAANSVVSLYTGVPADGDVSIGQVWQVDATGGPSYVDETADANDAGNADWVIFPAAEAVGDWVAIGYSEMFASLTLDNANGTAGVGGGVDWEYWNGAWTALSNVVDGTSAFTTATADGQVVSFDIPTDWVASVINGSSSLFFIRAVITGSDYSTNPIYDQGFIGGDAAEVGTGSLFEADIATDDVAYETFGDEQNAQTVVLRGIAETLEIRLSVSATLNGYLEFSEE